MYQFGRCRPMCQHAIQGRLVLVANEGGHRAGANSSWKKGTNCCSHGRKPLPPLAVSAEPPGGDAAYRGVYIQQQEFLRWPCLRRHCCLHCTGAFPGGLQVPGPWLGCSPVQTQHEAMARQSLQNQMLQSRVTTSLF